MLNTLGDWARHWARQSPWTNVYGVARSLVALSTAITLATTRAPYLFMPQEDSAAPQCDGVRQLGMFCAAPASLETLRWLAIAILLVVASGFRPRLTALPHWWVTASFAANATMLDGGDSVSAVLTLLFVPIALTDARTWHWQAALPLEKTRSNEMRRIVAHTAIALLRIQVSGIYFHAAVSKFAVEQWADGTALWYFVTDPMLGPSPWLGALLRPLFSNAAAVSTTTWGVLALEWLLSIGLFVDRRYRRPLLYAGIALHAAIVVQHGLVSFGLAMFAALLVYLRPADHPFGVLKLASRLRQAQSGTTPARSRLVARLLTGRSTYEIPCRSVVDRRR